MKTLSPPTRYVINLSIWMALYVAAIIFDGLYFRNHTSLGTPSAPWLYVFAVMPSVPVGGTIWTLLRFMDESDEYVRALITRRFVIATGVTLFVCTAWGFLENYANVRHFDLYYVYLLFWISMAVVSPFTRAAS